ncbi:MAG TPA: DUF559 domain-containing protein [Patescibacteria group bacterium]|nr:DUF559 domain-containing protein [Patescibacteria group bacterium]
MNGKGKEKQRTGRNCEMRLRQSGASPRHLWRGVRGEVGITGSQSVAPEKLELARNFRREMTPQERTLWEALRRNQLDGIHFRRQQVIRGYVVDFYCASARLAIEIDGDSHLSRREYDDERDRALAQVGITTLHINNREVEKDLDAVLRRIVEATRGSAPSARYDLPSDKGR